MCVLTFKQTMCEGQNHSISLTQPRQLKGRSKRRSGPSYCGASAKRSRLAERRGSGQHQRHLLIRVVSPKTAPVVWDSRLFSGDSQRQSNHLFRVVLSLQPFICSFIFGVFLRWNGRSAVHDASVPAGSCWKHERHDEFQQHVTANQQVA